MSGVVALFDRQQGAIQQHHLDAMLRRIDHRGPHGSATWQDSSIGVGYQELQSTPESLHDEQPLHESGLVAVVDARIDNRSELIDSLSLTTEPGRLPDSEVVLASYQRWETDCVDHLIGAYAFVIWDADKERLFCARDHMGVKPLHYYLDDDVFIAASEVKAILTHPAVPRRLNERKIGEFLSDSWVDKEGTYYESVNRLPPAHAIYVEAAGSEKWEYWDLDPTNTIDLPSDEAYERRFRELFEKAVRCRLRTNGRVGTMLSGGLDSSSVTAVARQTMSTHETISTFSAVFDDAPDSDERVFIDSLVHGEGYDSNYVFMDNIGYLQYSDEFLEHLDGIPPNTAFYMPWEIAKQANDNDISVMLTGVYGDVAVGYGFELLPQLFFTGKWLTLYRELDSLGDLFDRRIHVPFLRYVYPYVRPYIVPPVVDRLRGRLRGEADSEREQYPLLNREFCDRIGLTEFTDEKTPDKPDWDPTRRHYRAVSSPMLTAALEVMDLTYSAFGTEPRHPFSDKRLIEFLLAVPPSQQLQQGMTRSLLRRSLSDLLPEKIRQRRWKTMMDQAIVQSMLSEQGRLDNLLEDPGSVADYINLQYVKAAREELKTGSISVENKSILANTLWLHVWLETHGVDGSV